MEYAIGTVVPEHTREVRDRVVTLVNKTEVAVKERLAEEINYWDHRAAQLRTQEEAGKSKTTLNSSGARKRADELLARLQKRLRQLELERQITALPPVPVGGVLDKIGYDIESSIPETGRLRMIEVKGRAADAERITVTKNEILTALSTPDDFILAVVQFREGDTHSLHYVWRLFDGYGITADFRAARVVFPLQDVLAGASSPR